MRTISKPRGNAKDRVFIYRAIWITFSGNLILAGLKFYLSRLSPSSALYSDALNSISDVIYSLMIILGLILAIRPPDSDHPQGYTRFEPLLAIVISLSMGWAGIGAFLNAIEKIRDGVEPFAIALPIAALAFSAAIKGVMYLLIKRIADQVQSATLKASAADNLADTVTSFTAAVGIVLSRVGFPMADPIAAILVALWIFRAVIGLLNENLGFLTGAGIEEEERAAIYDAARSVPGVLDVHQIIGEHVGSRHVIDIHINADGEMKLCDVHEMISEVERRVYALSKDIERVYIHVEPPGYD